MIKSQHILGFMVIAMLSLTAASLYNVVYFNMWSTYSYYAYFLFIVSACIIYPHILRWNITFLAVTFIYLLLSILLSKGGYGSILNYIVPIAMLPLVSNASLSHRIRKFIMLLSIGIVCYLFVSSYSYMDSFYQSTRYNINANTLGMFLSHFFMIFTIYADFERKTSKIIAFLLLIMASVGSYNYDSRGSMLAIFTYIILLIFPNKLLLMKHYVFMCIVIIIVGTAFPLIFVYLYDIGFDLEIWGNSLYTGRELLWSNMFEMLKDKPVALLFGMGSKIQLIEGETMNVHNNYFNIVLCFGIIGYLLYFSYFITLITQLKKYSDDPIIRKGLLMFLCVALIYGMTETATTWMPTILTAFFGLIAANSEYNRIENESLHYTHLSQEGRT